MCGENGHNAAHHHGHCGICGEKGHNRRKCSKRPSSDADNQPSQSKYCKIYEKNIGISGKEARQQQINLIFTIIIRLFDEKPSTTPHSLAERVAFLTGFSYGFVRNLITDIQNGQWPIKREKDLKDAKIRSMTEKL